MTGSRTKQTILAFCLGTAVALSSHAQHSLEWIKEMPGQGQGAGPTTTIVPEANVPQSRPADPKRQI